MDNSSVRGQGVAGRMWRYICNWLSDTENVITLVVLVVGLGGYSSYRLYQYYRGGLQRGATVAFEESLQEYEEALQDEFDWQKKGTSEKWDDVDLAFQNSYERHKASSLAPFFLLYRAQAALFRRAYDEALSFIEQAKKEIKSTSPFHIPLEILHASVLIDRGTAQEGVDKLKQVIAEDGATPFANMARYYLAQYWIAQNKRDEALPLFAQVAEDKNSPWADLAQKYTYSEL